MLILPYRVERRFAIPLVTIALIVVNTLIYAATALSVNEVAQVAGFKANVAGVATWFTSMFLHADPFHLIGNMYFLWLFGSVVEDAIGRLRYVVLYTLGGLGAAVLYALMTAVFTPQHLDIPMIGASGALSAVVGMFAVRFHRDKVRLFYFYTLLYHIKWGTFAVSSVFAVVMWGLRELFYGMVSLTGLNSGVANWAHIGGLLFGAAAALMLGFNTEADIEKAVEESSALDIVGVPGLGDTSLRHVGGADPNDPGWKIERARQAMAAQTYGDSNAASFVEAMGELLRIGRKDEAISAYEQLGTTYPLPADSLLGVAQAAEGLRKYMLALRAYRELDERFRGTAEAEKGAFRMPHVYLAMGMDAQAQEAWRGFEAAHPTSQWLPYADSRLMAAG